MRKIVRASASSSVPASSKSAPGLYSTAGSHNVGKLEDLAPTLKVGSSTASGVPVILEGGEAYDIRNGSAASVTQTLQAGGMGDGRGLCINAIPHVVHAPKVSAPILTGSGGGRTTDIDGGARIVQETYNIVPEYGQGADLRAIPSDISNAVTVTDHAKQTDRGIRVISRRPKAYEVDKERGVPNSEGIRVDATTTSPTITAAGDPTERTDRGLRIVGQQVTTTAVRRLTPTECERLQGFPDGWTAVPPLPRKTKKKA